MVEKLLIEPTEHILEDEDQNAGQREAVLVEAQQ